MQTINSGSSAQLTIGFLDANRVPVTPVSASYEILCMTTGNVVRSPTTISSLSPTVTLTLTPSDNAIQDSTNRNEGKRVIVKSADSLGNVTTADYFYVLRNVWG